VIGVIILGHGGVAEVPTAGVVAAGPVDVDRVGGAGEHEHCEECYHKIFHLFSSKTVNQKNQLFTANLIIWPKDLKYITTLVKRLLTAAGLGTSAGTTSFAGYSLRLKLWPAPALK
jgi:hypothetical protein